MSVCGKEILLINVIITLCFGLPRTQTPNFKQILADLQRLQVQTSQIDPGYASILGPQTSPGNNDTASTMAVSNTGSNLASQGSQAAAQEGSAVNPGSVQQISVGAKTGPAKAQGSGQPVEVNSFSQINNLVNQGSAQTGIYEVKAQGANQNVQGGPYLDQGSAQTASDPIQNPGTQKLIGSLQGGQNLDKSSTLPMMDPAQAPGTDLYMENTQSGPYANQVPGTDQYMGNMQGGQYVDQSAVDPTQAPRTGQFIGGMQGDPYVGQAPGIDQFMGNMQGGQYVDQGSAQTAIDPTQGLETNPFMGNMQGGPYIEQPTAQAATDPAQTSGGSQFVGNMQGGPYMDQGSTQPATDPTQGPGTDQFMGNMQGGPYMDQGSAQTATDPTQGPGIDPFMGNMQGSPYMEQGSAQSATDPSQAAGTGQYMENTQGGPFLPQVQGTEQYQGNMQGGPYVDRGSAQTTTYETQAPGTDQYLANMQGGQYVDQGTAQTATYEAQPPGPDQFVGGVQGGPYVDQGAAPTAQTATNVDPSSGADQYIGNMQNGPFVTNIEQFRPLTGSHSFPGGGVQPNFQGQGQAQPVVGDPSGSMFGPFFQELSAAAGQLFNVNPLGFGPTQTGNTGTQPETQPSGQPGSEPRVQPEVPVGPQSDAQPVLREINSPSMYGKENSLLDSKGPIADPVHGGMTLWTDWGPCNVTCGTGYQRRDRDCTNPRPSNGGIDCYEHYEEFKECVMPPCTDVAVDPGVQSNESLSRAFSPEEITKTLKMFSKLTRDLKPGTASQKVSVEPDFLKQPNQVKSQVLLKQLQMLSENTVQLVDQFKQKVPMADINLPTNQNSILKTDFNLETTTINPINQGEPNVNSIEQITVPTTPQNNQGDPNAILTDQVMFPTIPQNMQGDPNAILMDSVTTTNQLDQNSILIDQVTFPTIQGDPNMLVKDYLDFPSKQKNLGDPNNMIATDPSIDIHNKGSPNFASIDQVTEPTIQQDVFSDTYFPSQDNVVPVAGQTTEARWGEWLPWGPCDTTCGNSKQVRVRFCDRSQGIGGKHYCVGKDFEARPCVKPDCPVNGGWSDWTLWGPCDRSCGTGSSIRYRECNSPKPSNGGAACSGSREQSKPCNIDPCPVDGGWSDWTLWGPCDRSCGTGASIRYRECNSPATAYGGIPCTGPREESKPCNTDPCPADGGWSVWTMWGPCDRSCGTGSTFRYRKCNNPKPSYGGVTCSGSREEFKECNTIPCPVNGGWSNWTMWGPCDHTCGTGFSIRNRKCNNPKPAYGGKSCKGVHEEFQECNIQPCTVNGGWSNWTMWGPCDHTCGTGFSVRNRKCNNPKPAYGGKSCMGVHEEFQECNIQPCTVDGGWSDWTLWGPCDRTCGTGSSLRSRQCNNPKPAYGGVSCAGQAKEFKECNTMPCPVNGGWSDWTMWGQCDRSCGTGSSFRYRKCNNPKPAYGGMSCIGPLEEFQECNTMPCPVNGGWSKWTLWGSCDRSCGTGSSLRRRKCNNPIPAYGGVSCKGPREESKECNTMLCPVNGGWSVWTEWGPCDRSCDSGISVRFRECNKPVPSYGGASCSGLGQEFRECNNQPCRVDGNWSGWSKWTLCSVSCGHGTKSRARACNSPSPAYGGKKCPGIGFEIASCHLVVCPVNGGWTKWSAWGRCDATCGAGKKIRTRRCANPKPLYGGLPCTGKATDSKPCNEQPCIVDGNWSLWSPWGSCDVTCGNGNQERTRECNNPAPGYGGLECEGFGRQMRTCNRKPCTIPIGWAPWEPWGRCSASCDIGLQRRERVCNSTFIGEKDRLCFGDSSEYRLCMPGACADGGWSYWSQWSKCTTTCGTGTRTRIRLCNSPPPSVTGKHCVGEPSQTEACKSKSCEGALPAFTVEKPAAIIDGKLTFTNTILNQGDDFDPLNGEFLCTRPGTYFFSVSLAKKRDFIRIDKVYCNLYKNNDTVIYAGVDPADDDTDKGNAQAHNAAVIHLKYGDSVSLQGCSSPPTFFMEDWSSFTGFLLRPDD